MFFLSFFCLVLCSKHSPHDSTTLASFHFPSFLCFLLWDTPEPPRNSRKNICTRMTKNMADIAQIMPSKSTLRENIGASFPMLQHIRDFSWKSWCVIFSKHRYAEVSTFPNYPFYFSNTVFVKDILVCVERIKQYSIWCDRKYSKPVQDGHTTAVKLPM